MAQLGHPYSSQVKASQRRRLSALGAKQGKSWGSSASQHEKKYPSKNAGTERPMTISGKTAGARADRYAAGGGVKGKSKGKGHTTNVIIAGGGPRAGGEATPPPRPVPVPVPVGGPPPGLPRPPGAGPPVGPAIGPAIGPPPGLPPGPPPGMPMRPPGMKHGGKVTAGAGSSPSHEFHDWGVGYRKSGGAVKKAPASEGFMADKKPGNAYRGFPHSPTTSVDDAVSASKRGGAVKKAFGGPIAKKEKHDDEKQDRALFSKMMQEKSGEKSKKAAGGSVSKQAVFKAGSGTGMSRIKRNKEAAKIPAETEL